MPMVDKSEALERLEAYKRSLRPFDCLLCAVRSAVEETDQVIASNAHGLVVLNRFGQRRGHLMVLSRRHVDHLHELDWTACAELQRLAYDANIALKRTLAPLRIFSAVLGTDAPIATSYAHLHVHVLPIHEADERSRPARVFTWSEGVYVYGEGEAEALAAELRAAWPEP